MCLFHVFPRKLSSLCFPLRCFSFHNVLIRRRLAVVCFSYVFWGPTQWFAQGYRTSTETWGWLPVPLLFQHFLFIVCFKSLAPPSCHLFLCTVFHWKSKTPLHSVGFLFKTLFFRELRVSVAIQAEKWLCLGQYFSNLDPAIFNGKKFSADIRFFICNFYHSVTLDIYRTKLDTNQLNLLLLFT